MSTQQVLVIPPMKSPTTGRLLGWTMTHDPDAVAAELAARGGALSIDRGTSSGARFTATLPAYRAQRPGLRGAPPVVGY